MQNDNWIKEKNKLQRTLQLKDFMAVVEAVNKIAKVAEEKNHHPDLRIFNYNNLEITISNHEESKLTDKDFALATSIDEVI